MKNKLLLLILSVALIVSLLALSSCSDTGGADADSETNVPTDTQDTSTDKTDTGNSSDDTVDSSYSDENDSDEGGSEIFDHEHIWNHWAHIKIPTCSEEGLNERLCIMCGEIDSMTVEKLQHSYVGMEFPPIGNEPGYIEYACKYCDDSYREEV